MIEAIQGFLNNLFGSSYFGQSAIVFILSMLPAVGGPSVAIPIGAVLGLPMMLNALMGIAGNILPAPFIILFVRKIFIWMRKKSRRLGALADKYEAKAKANSSRFRYGSFVGLMLFVAIPLPLPAMGAWSGSLIAAVFDIRLRISLPAIALGVVIAGIITTAVTYGFISLVL